MIFAKLEYSCSYEDLHEELYQLLKGNFDKVKGGL